MSIFSSTVRRWGALGAVPFLSASLNKAHSSEKGFNSDNCNLKCVTPFNTFLGSIKGVEAYSNCQPLCLNPKPRYVGDVYTGVSNQCVEYARRYLVKTQGFTFGGVDFAYQIWDLASAYNPHKESEKRKFINYSNPSPYKPESGDLIIYSSSPDLPAGHVAVVTDVQKNKDGSDKYTVYVAEQNFDNKIWAYPNKGARALTLEGKNTIYKLNDGNEVILGWKRVQ